MQAEIITIGDEILIGQVIDTNSAWLAEQLNLIGISVKQITSVSDNESHILSALEEASARVDLILMTGGLGPTKDDLTKETLCKYFNTRLIFNQEVYNHIENIFSHRQLPMLESNRKQAELPENCTIIPNRRGTAAGMYFVKNNRHYFSMPGVPFEMKTIVSEHILPLLQSKFKLPVIFHRTILTYGIGESFLAEKIKEWEMNLPANIKLAYLPSPEALRLRLTIKGDDKESLHKTIQAHENKLSEIIDEYIFGFDRQTMPEILGNLLRSKGNTISTAESCTGGNIARLITTVPGSSAYFAGSLVAYSNQIKERILHVKPEDLNKYGAVSEQVVKAMASNAREFFNTDFSIATSGIAGPDGGTEQKPVGTVWIAIADKQQVTARKYTFTSDRDINIRRASSMAMFMLIKMIEEKD